MNKYALDNFKRSEDHSVWSVPLDDAVTAKRNLLIFQVGVGVTLAGLALWGAWMIGLDLIFWGLLMVVGIAVSFAVVIYLWDKVWDFGFWLKDQQRLIQRAKDYGVIDE